MSKLKVVIVPGNGGCKVEYSNWYASVRDEISSFLRSDQVILRNMPDPVIARESIWVPFMRDELNCDANTIIIGHSSGAVAAIRFAETYKVAGIILVSAYVSDLGIDSERESGYFNRPWKWAEAKKNAGFIVQFGSTDDPFLPWTEQEEVATNLSADLKKFENKGHFMNSVFPELVEVVKERVKTCKL